MGEPVRREFCRYCGHRVEAHVHGASMNPCACESWRVSSALREGQEGKEPESEPLGSAHGGRETKEGPR